MVRRTESGVSRRRWIVPSSWATLVLVASLALASCAAPVATDPAQPCNGADVQERAGFYPELEQRIPVLLDGAPPTTRSSGRYCSPKTLGTLAEHGISEEQFAGATWRVTGESGISLVVYRASGLGPRFVADAFRAGAAASRNGKSFVATGVQVLGREGYRLDVVNGDRRQVVVIWPSGDGSVVHTVIGSDVAEERIQAAIAALG